MKTLYEFDINDVKEGVMFVAEKLGANGESHKIYTEYLTVYRYESESRKYNLVDMKNHSLYFVNFLLAHQIFHELNKINREGVNSFKLKNS